MPKAVILASVRGRPSKASCQSAGAQIHPRLQKWPDRSERGHRSRPAGRTMGKTRGTAGHPGDCSPPGLPHRPSARRPPPAARPRQTPSTAGDHGHRCCGRRHGGSDRRPRWCGRVAGSTAAAARCAVASRAEPAAAAAADVAAAAAAWWPSGADGTSCSLWDGGGAAVAGGATARKRRQPLAAAAAAISSSGDGDPSRPGRNLWVVCHAPPGALPRSSSLAGSPLAAKERESRRCRDCHGESSLPV